MGIFRFQNVDHWQHAMLRELHELRREPDDAGPIGTRQASPVAHTATWITLDPGTGQLVYGGEKNIEVYKGHDRELPEGLQQKLGMRQIRGWLFQVRKDGPNPQPESLRLFEGKEILLSKLPHSRNYFIRRKLKRCKHEAAIWKQVGRAWDKHADMPLTDERLDRVLSELAVTPFIHAKECLAAWAVSPQRFDVLGDERFDTADDYTIAALDLPIQKAMDWLRIDPVVQGALAATDKGQLFNGYRPANKSLWKSGPALIPVTEGLNERKEQLMEAACFAALCGREVKTATDAVVESAVLLYHRFAYHFVRREKEWIARPRSTSPDWGETRTDQWSSPGEESESAPEQVAREYTEKWRQLSEEAASHGLAQVIHHVLNTPADQVDEEFVRRMRPALAGWPPGWRRPKGFAQAIERLGQRFACPPVSVVIPHH